MVFPNVYFLDQVTIVKLIPGFDCFATCINCPCRFESTGQDGFVFIGERLKDVYSAIFGNLSE